MNAYYPWRGVRQCGMWASQNDVLDLICHNNYGLGSPAAETISSQGIKSNSLFIVTYFN